MERTRFYYLRTEHFEVTKRGKDYLAGGEPIVTVCLLTNGDAISRGVAVCSIYDKPCKKEGRRHALAYARRALGTENNFKVLDEMSLGFANAWLDLESDSWDIFEGFNFHSEFDPELNDYEKHLLQKMK